MTGLASLPWSTSTGGALDSSPIVVDGVLYIGSDDTWVYALNAGKGEILWQTKTGGAVDSSPAVVNGALYVGSDDDRVYALDAATGQILWETITSGAVDSSPTVLNGILYIGADDGWVFALDATSGGQIWSYPTGGPLVSIPFVAGGIVFVGSADHSVYALSQLLYNWSGFFQPVNNAPAVNQFKAGKAIPVKFSLGGNQGLDTFASGYPLSEQIACDSNGPLDNIEETVPAGSSSISYDAMTDTYTYVWKTGAAWAGTCR